MKPSERMKEIKLRLAKCTEALEFYANCFNYQLAVCVVKVDKKNKVIEYGQAIPVMADKGTRAREALSDKVLLSWDKEQKKWVENE